MFPNLPLERLQREKVFTAVGLELSGTLYTDDWHEVQLGDKTEKIRPPNKRYYMIFTCHIS